MAEKIAHTFEYQQFDSTADLAEEDRRLLEAAREACNTAYAPYSGFHVGAALLLADGTLVTGSNQENAAYPDGLCAERVALFAAGAQHKDIPVVKIAVAARPGHKENGFVPAAPCGSCRQVMLEYESKQDQPMQLITQWANEKIIVLPTISQLLPLSFTKEALRIVE